MDKNERNHKADNLTIITLLLVIIYYLSGQNIFWGILALMVAITCIVVGVYFINENRQENKAIESFIGNKKQKECKCEKDA